MIAKNILKVKIIECLKALHMHSTNAVELLMGTAAQESRFYHTTQLGGGPALGYFQMEPDTFKDIVNRYLVRHPDWVQTILEVCSVDELNPRHLEHNVELMVCFARIHYYRVPEALPNNLHGYARYWKKYYNTCHGHGTIKEFETNYKMLVL